MKYVKLKPNSKFPQPSTSGHHDISETEWELPYGNGISLDGEFVAIDFDRDHPQREAMEKSLPPTWSQRTKRTDAIGMHYLFTLPPGFEKGGGDIITPDGTVIGDIKFKGYIVAPGTIIDGKTYTRICDLDPMPILPGTLSALYGPPKPPKPHSVPSTPEAKTAEGGRNKMLTKRGGSYRRIDASPEELEAMLLVANQQLCEPPLPTKEVINIAHSLSKYASEKEPSVGVWPSAYDLPKKQPDIEWSLFRYIPEYKLSMQFGKGAIGKSTWVSWLARKLLLEGKKFGFSATEESFAHFSNGVRLGIKDFDEEIMRNLVDLGKDWMFPRDEEKLRKGLEQQHLDFIYFDAIYDIFDSKGQGAFANTRQNLKPLTIAAEEFEVTIFGTFHENRNGTFNGSEEMRSIPRVLSHAKKDKDTERLRLTVEKTNYKRPENDLLFYGEWMIETNLDGSAIREKNEDGIWEDNKIFIVYGYDKVEVEEDDDSTPKDTISLKDMEPTISNDDAYYKVYNCLKTNPTWGWSKIADETGLSERVVKTRLQKIC